MFYLRQTTLSQLSHPLNQILGSVPLFPAIHPKTSFALNTSTSDTPGSVGLIPTLCYTTSCDRYNFKLQILPDARQWLKVVQRLLCCPLFLASLVSLQRCSTVFSLRLRNVSYLTWTSIFIACNFLVINLMISCVSRKQVISNYYADESRVKAEIHYASFSLTSL